MSGKSSAGSYTVVSLFAGCGGLDLGFHGDFTVFDQHYAPHAFDIVLANDIDINAMRTYAHNLPSPTITGDIRDLLKGKDLPAAADIILGGFPCQDFSHAGKRLGFDADRGQLYKAMSQTIRRLRPKLFLAENVKGLLTLNDGEAIATIVRDFSKLGYHVTYRLYNTAAFGVPQRRERVVIIGTDKRILPSFEMPHPILTEPHWVSLRRAIGDLDRVKEGALPNHYWSRAKRNSGQGNSIVDADRPGPTMRAEHHGNIEYHWRNHRRLSAREAARIQSFPDDFEFLPSTSAAYKQIGNAVPPVFAWHIAKEIERFLDKHL